MNEQSSPVNQDDFASLVRALQILAPDANDRVMVFVDWSYVVNGIRDLAERRAVDVAKLSQVLTRGRRLIRTYVYEGRIDSPPDPVWQARQQGQQRFEAALASRDSIEIRWGRLQFGEGQPRQKGVDVLLSLDMLRFAIKNNYDTAVLISGDGDFADIVQMVKDEGKTVEVAMFRPSSARALRQAADRVVTLDLNLLNNCWMPAQAP